MIAATSSDNLLETTLNVDADVRSLFCELPDARAAEVTTVLVHAPHVRIERVVSQGQCSPDRFWYDQEEAEWVVVLSGAARLLLEGESGPRLLQAGDHLLLPAHTRHRIEWTTPETPTVWLAVFFADERNCPDLQDLLSGRSTPP